MNRVVIVPSSVAGWAVIASFALVPAIGYLSLLAADLVAAALLIAALLMIATVRLVFMAAKGSATMAVDTAAAVKRANRDRKNRTVRKALQASIKESKAALEKAEYAAMMSRILTPAEGEFFFAYDDDEFLER